MPIAGAAAIRSFRGAKSGSEHILTMQAQAGQSFAAQIEEIERSYAAGCADLGLAPETAVFRRLFLSDAPNQTAQLHDSPLLHDPAAGPVAVSIVQQPPLPDAKLALLAYHVQDGAPLTKQLLAPSHVLVRRNGARHLWSTRLCAGATNGPIPTAEQTNSVFADLIGTLDSQGGTLRQHCVRTWLYVKDVDVFYQDMVAARTALFERQGLRRDTHYIASTGIEGTCAHRYDTVLMDAYANLDLAPAQVSYLNDFDRLCATKDYNVTFERGTRIGYADRAHHFISGTASIDHTGRVLHPGDVLRQLERTLENVDALLRSGGATLAHMTYLLVYLRDPSDLPRVEPYLRERLPDLPMLFLRGAVCRPDWLVEVEGVAIAAADSPELPPF